MARHRSPKPRLNCFHACSNRATPANQIYNKEFKNFSPALIYNGIADGLFSKREILEQFNEKNIKIPESLMLDFDNTIRKKIFEKII